MCAGRVTGLIRRHTGIINSSFVIINQQRLPLKKAAFFY
jgi:hypothetical protein